MRLFLLFVCLPVLTSCVVGCDDSYERAEAEYTLGALAIRHPDSPDLTLAYEHFNKAIAIDPSYIPAYLGRAYVLQQNGQSSEALAEYSKAVTIDPTAGNTLLLRGKLNRASGNYDAASSDLREAISLYTTAMDKDFETGVGFESKRREANLQLGIGLFEQGKLDEALTELDNTFKLLEGTINPNPAAHYWRGRIYYEKCHEHGKEKQVAAAELQKFYKLAIKDFGDAIWDNGKYADAYSRRGWAQFEIGNYMMAESDSQAAIKLNKNLADAYYNLARIYSMAADPSFRKGKEAVQNARVACKLTKNKSWYCLAAAGAAFAEAGDFNRAQKAQQMAIKLAPKHHRGELIERLSLFRKKQPFRYRFPESTARQASTVGLTAAQ